MKKILLITFCSIICISNGLAQPDRLVYYGGYIWGEDSSGFYLANYDGQCDNDSETEFTVAFDNVNRWGKVDYNVKIWKVPFSHLYDIDNAAGEFEYTYPNQEFPDDFDENEATAIFDSGMYANEESGDFTYSVTGTILIEADYAYYATVDTRKSGIIPGPWRWGHSESFNFDTGLIPTSFDLVPSNHISSIFLPSFYGTTEVFEFNQLNDILFDGNASICEDRHLYTVEEFNLDTWTGVPGTQYNSGWEMEEIEIVDLTPHHTYVPGKIYHMSAAVGPVWYSADYFFRMKQATVDCSLPASQGYHQVFVTSKGGGTAIYNVQELCDNIAQIYLDGSGSQYESEYRVDISEVNPSNMNVIAGTTVSQAYVSGEAPSNINLSVIYTGGGMSFNTSKTYKATLYVRNNEVQKSVYFDFKSCLGKSAFGVDESVSDQVEFAIYPNPTTGKVSVSVDGLEVGESYEVDIYDLQGRQLRHIGPIMSSRFNLDLSEYTSGMYMVKVTTQSGEEFKRLIKE